MRLVADGLKPMRYAIEQLLSGFRILSAVLVTSTIAALLFFQMALGPYITTQENIDTSGLATYISGLATFWGAVYTLTLFAAYIGPLAVMYYRARAAMEEKSPDQFLSLRDWLATNGVEDGLTQRIKNILALFAPLMVGPLTEIVSAVGG